jgi:hypothetical protein
VKAVITDGAQHWEQTPVWCEGYTKTLRAVFDDGNGSSAECGAEKTMLSVEN